MANFRRRRRADAQAPQIEPPQQQLFQIFRSLLRSLAPLNKSVMTRAPKQQQQQRTTDIKLTNEATQTQASYVAQLQAATAQVKNLDAAERAEIAAAQKMGAETRNLEDMLVRYGVSGVNTEVVLSLLSEQTKDEGRQRWRSSYCCRRC